MLVDNESRATGRRTSPHRSYYIAIATDFVYMAAILDAWSRRVVEYATGRSIDARLAVAP